MQFILQYTLDVFLPLILSLNAVAYACYINSYSTTLLVMTLSTYLFGYSMTKFIHIMEQRDMEQSNEVSDLERKLFLCF